MSVRGATEAFFDPSICARALHARVPRTARCLPVCHRRLDGHMVARRRYVPVKTRTESREAPERGRYMRLARLVNPRRSAPRVDKVDEVSSGLCPPAAIHRGITSGEHLFHPRTAIPRALTPPPSVACLCGRRRPPVGNSVLIELIERRGRSERCGAVETAGSLHLAVAAPSIPSSWRPFRPRLAASAVVLPAALCAPTLGWTFVALPPRAWTVGGGFLAYSAAAVRDCALNAVPLPLCGAVCLARRRDFAVGGGTPI